MWGTDYSSARPGAPSPGHPISPQGLFRSSCVRQCLVSRTPTVQGRWGGEGVRGGRGRSGPFLDPPPSAWLPRREPRTGPQGMGWGGGGGVRGTAIYLKMIATTRLCTSVCHDGPSNGAACTAGHPQPTVSAGSSPREPLFHGPRSERSLARLFFCARWPQGMPITLR